MYKTKSESKLARVVTIVVLIILAGITLNAVIGENGIILQAKDTKNLITNETTYDNAQLAQLQNELKDNGLYSGIGIIPGTDTGGGSEGGENGIGGGGNQGSDTNTGTGGNSSGGDSQNQNATVKPINTQNQNPGGGTLVGGKTDEDPLIYVVSGEEIAASFYQSDVTIQIYTNDRSKKIKYILTTTVAEISNELYPSGLVRELDIENGGTLTFTKDGEYTITAYAYDTAGNKSNPTIMWLKRQVGGSTTGGITVSIASGNEGANKWYTSNVTLRVLGTDTGSKKVKYRVRGVATSTGQIGDKEVTGVGIFDSGEVEITNGTTFRIVADGTYSITAYSYDAGGMRLSSSEVLTLKKDATRPTIKSYTGEQIPGQGFKVKISAEDTGAGLTSNAYTYRHKLSTSLEEYTSEVSGNAEKLYTGLNQQKTYDMYVMVTDQAGNIAITDVIAKPSLWISRATIGEKVNDGKEGSRQYSRAESTELTFRGQDSNNVDIMKTTYQVLGTVDKAGNIAGNSVTVGQQLGDEYQLGDKETRTIQLQADGNWTVKVHNYNKEGKLVTTNTVEVTRDITPPTISTFTIGTITYRTTGSGTATTGVTEVTSGLATKNDAYIYYLGSTSKATQASNRYTYTDITGSAMPKVTVKDKSGNTSTKELTNKISQINFEYVGQVQSFTLPAGKYKLEVWGAQGGSSSDGSISGGKGGYASSEVNISDRTIEFVVVGGKAGAHITSGGGGGASYIYQITQSPQVVAGGGGGWGTRAGGNAVAAAGSGNGGNVATEAWAGGCGGGWNSAGTDGKQYGGTVKGSGGGSLSTGGKGGVAGTGWNYGTNGGFGGGGGGNYGAGGGGGYTGGDGGNATGSAMVPGSGGSCFGDVRYGGNQSFPAPGGGKETGHSGNGYARITLVE